MLPTIKPGRTIDAEQGRLLLERVERMHSMARLGIPSVVGPDLALCVRAYGNGSVARGLFRVWLYFAKRTREDLGFYFRVRLYQLSHWVPYRTALRRYAREIDEEACNGGYPPGITIGFRYVTDEGEDRYYCAVCGVAAPELFDEDLHLKPVAMAYDRVDYDYGQTPDPFDCGVCYKRFDGEVWGDPA